jgi:hypothetical protein
MHTNCKGDIWVRMKRRPLVHMDDTPFRVVHPPVRGKDPINFIGAIDTGGWVGHQGGQSSRDQQVIYKGQLGRVPVFVSEEGEFPMRTRVVGYKVPSTLLPQLTTIGSLEVKTPIGHPHTWEARSASPDDIAQVPEDFIEWCVVIDVMWMLPLCSWTHSMFSKYDEGDYMLEHIPPPG